MTYSIGIRNERLQIIKNHIVNGLLQIIDSAGLKLVEMKILKESVNINAGVLTVDSLSGIALAEGRAEKAKIIEQGGDIAIDDLIVGTDETANLIIDNKFIQKGQTIKLTIGKIIHS